MLEIVRSFNHSSVDVIYKTTDKFKTNLYYNSDVCYHFPSYYGCNNKKYLSTKCESFVGHVDMSTTSVYIDPGTKMKEVPGLVYSRAHSFPVFKTGHHDGKNRMTWLPKIKSSIPVASYNISMGTVVQEYPCGKSHFIREALPRFMLLVQAMLYKLDTQKVNILVPKCKIKEYMKYLTPSEMNRVKLYPWTNANIYRTNSVYYTGEVANNNSRWSTMADRVPFNFQNTLGFCAPCIRLRRKMRDNMKDKISCSIAFLQRSGVRQVENSKEMMHMLHESFPQYNITEFQIVNNNISFIKESIGNSAVLISPHGAGLSNIYFLPTDAIVVELAYTGKKSMRFPVNYYHDWSQTCNNTHILSTAYGEYNTGMKVDISVLKSVLQNAIKNSLKHNSICNKVI